MSAIDNIRDRLVILRDDHGGTASKMIAGGLVLAVVAGAYMTGKRVERQWWRTEIAARSAAVKSIMGQLDQEAPDFDERLIKEWSREHVEPLRAAERRLHEAQNRPPAAAEPSCLLPARCLQ